MEKDEENSNSLQIDSLFKKMESINYPQFYKVESEFCSIFSMDKRKSELPLINAFLVVSNLYAASERSGVWTYYEAEDPQKIKNAVNFLNNRRDIDLADIIRKGIHDYQNPKYAKNFEYPEKWIEDSDEIDDWISEYSDYLQKWLYDLLMENRESISSLF